MTNGRRSRPQNPRGTHAETAEVVGAAQKPATGMVSLPPERKERREMGSLVYQIESAFRVIFTPGASRHAAKRRGEADQYIYSFATLGKYLRVCNDSVRWVKGRFGISRLGDLAPHMVMAFIRLRQSEPLPNGRLR